MKFKVNENETISECLSRMREEGYMPVKRIEKPIYTEDEKGNVVVLRQDIQFVGKKL
ncbi:NETI motif-containing protein [Staphylococcus haemolyticus]|uniref:NETI motif-containing protein n=1 Tax=Staphylococcus TaxID=1279 RepID=UPI0008A98D9A|nr:MULTISPECIES: NETI motif-containing protein [Staphylococcus]MCE0455305.1 NETI motif-containing protein [Staphylococcus haemolyticus]MCH4476101.1 NETI motif-containing protein [Staphylococcus haemolyticus]MCI2934522.1 NETI motif-containing protein [Staphylococcus haemolyticus]MEB2655948.1 NETI motif-containing protein [Staphylococcus haemolyticus]OLF64311.1 NETI motif-containing protein [Staphylococcus sp. MB377]